MEKILTITLILITHFGFAQKIRPSAIHSHNDYNQVSPFYGAFGLQCGSIEADVYLKNGALMVAHAPNEISAERTLNSLYIEPIVAHCIKSKKGRIYPKHSLQLLIDLKTAATPTLDSLVAKLRVYPHIFGNKGSVRVVISGNMPKPDDFEKYPSWIYFDGRFNQTYTQQSLKKIALMSMSMTEIIKWDGERELTPEEKEKITERIEQAHKINKKIRFWATPDTPLVWKELVSLGVDWIGTDMPQKVIGHQ
jgi:alkaline phosphatase